MTAVLPFIEEAKCQFETDGRFDVQMLDRVVAAMNTGSGEEQRQANLLLIRVKEDPNSWTKVDAILEYSGLPESKYFALQILECVIQTRWRTLPAVQRDGIKSFIVQFILKLSETNELAHENELLLHKLNLVLVQIVKQDWPKNWPNFISDIVEASKNSDAICVNNMNILKLLSEEVFDFGSQNLTQAKEQHLKKQFCGQFQDVFTLCVTIFERCYDSKMVDATLHTLHRFLSWIPVGYVFETSITELLAENFLPLDMFRVITLQCLTEIAQIGLLTEEERTYEVKLRKMFVSTLLEVKRLLGDASNLAEAYRSSSDSDQRFISSLAQFLTSFLREHGTLVEACNGRNADVKEVHEYAIHLLLQISTVEETEIFKVCLDYWVWLTSDMFRQFPFSHDMTPCRSIIMSRDDTRRTLYSPTLSRLRVIMISRMAKPEEVLVVENDQGEVIREIVKDTDSMALYKIMRETLVYLTHLDYRDTEQKMTDKLATQVNGNDFSWKNLNTLCWAVGSISGTMNEEDEKRFLVLVIRDLLGLCEQKRGKDNKAVIASNIMYVVGQYPRFLRAHWKFLKTVINKLFEFMHETHEGVQDMACDTFIKIAIKCKKHFVVTQAGETQAFVDEILSTLTTIICDLSQSQVHIFYEAVGHIISAQTDPNLQERLISSLMVLPNGVWDEVMTHAQGNPELLKECEVLRNLQNLLKTNVAACKSIGLPFLVQLQKIYEDALNVYRILSEDVSEAVKTMGEEALQIPVVRLMRAVKREILVLFSTWVAKAENEENVLVNFVPLLFDAVLFDYQKNVPGAREPKVLSLLSIIVTALKVTTMLNRSFEEKAAPEVPRIFESVFECTLEMINKDFEEYPEHRTGFFRLLLSLTQHCFPVFLTFPEQQLSYVVDAVVWAFQHTMRNVAEIGLDILKDMLDKVSELPDAQSQPFYKRFYMQILQHVLAVVADSNQVQVAGMTYHAEVMCKLFNALEFNIKVPLSPDPNDSNVDYVFRVIGGILQQAFGHLSEDQILITVQGFLSFNVNLVQMKNHIRDFLVQIKERNGEDTTDLFLEERKKEIADAQSKKNLIPGMMNPNEANDEDEMR